MKKLFFLILVVMTIAGCGGDSTTKPQGFYFNVDSAGNSQFDLGYLGTALLTYPLNTPDQAEIDGLMRMREEEKLARDVYQAMYNLHGLPVFDNVSQSEETHTLAIKALLDRYSLTDPVTGLLAGEFATDQMQQLYDDLVSAGTPQLVDALSVGVLIEEMDIYDIELLKQQVVDNDDIVLVYNNLQKGSRNHMRAFYARLLDAGGQYTPLFLSIEEFDAIVNSDIERGAP